MSDGTHDPEAVERDLARVTGLKDRDVLAQLRLLGFTADTVVLLFLVPLVQVAWANGSVTAAERAEVLSRAARGGVLPGTRSYAVLTRWLDVQPDAAFYSACFDAIRTVALLLPEETDVSIAHELLRSGRAVAHASGGVLGFGAVSAEEKALLARLAAELAALH